MLATTDADAQSAAVPADADTARVPANEIPVEDPSATQLDRVLVLGRRQSLVGEAVSASEGVVGKGDIADRPLLRTGDLLEFVPGLIATSHSGSGKANQYFLRGFNLDHGTDFATYVDGMPVNMRTHGHGQGYTDLNFLIPETVEQLVYRKGTYYADVGDFSSAGSAQFSLVDDVAGHAALSLGGEGYRRAMLMDSVTTGPGSLLLAGEAQTYDGPWTDIDEDVRKLNVLLRYGFEAFGGRAHINAMGYQNTWNSPDQVPTRAVEAGVISRFGSLDTDLGGESSRYSLSGGWTGRAMGGELQASAYAIDYSMSLWSNFTYFLDDLDNGDQFQQVDERKIYGFLFSQQWEAGRSRWRAGAEGRFDDIGRVLLLRTVQRHPVSTVRDDVVEQGSAGMYVANEFRFNDSVRSYLGVRRDQYWFNVDSSLPVNSGDASDGITSYKASVAYQAGPHFEWYASYGTGFHSNDARGTTIIVDPISGEPVDGVDALVGSAGYELGSRFHLDESFHATLALWSLKLDSELLFVGDAGTTESSRPSRREGVELDMYWFPSEHYSTNLEVSYTNARFTDGDPAGNRIPGSIPLVLAAGLNARYDSGWNASLQFRHFGKYPLIEDNSVASRGSTILNARVGREWSRWSLHLDVLNALDSDDHDIDYFYASRLFGEAEGGVEDIHFHILPKRTLRAELRFEF